MLRWDLGPPVARRSQLVVDSFWRGHCYCFWEIYMHARLGTVSLLGLALLLSACGGVTLPPQGGTPPPADTTFGTLSTLKVSGEPQEINQKLKINVVFVGYNRTLPGQVAGPRDITPSAFDESMPGGASNVVRVPSAYGQEEKTGNSFDYQYNYVFADESYSNDYFKYLASIGTERPLTLFQAGYNCQSLDTDKVLKQVAPATKTQPAGYACPTPAPNIAQPVTGNLEIDPVQAENWLADNSSRVGVSAGEYTVYLVNWYGRSDFRFHSYANGTSLDSDTGTNFAARASRRGIAWGGDLRQGSTQRVWFYDLSANPESWTSNWDISNADVDGDKVTDYRMPPIWEYGTRKRTYRTFDKVNKDLALVTRYVATNLLFTPSPIYRAQLTPPILPDAIQLNFALEQGVGAAAQTNVIKPDLIASRLQALQPSATLTQTVRTTPLDGTLAAAYKCLFPVKAEDICSPNAADPTGDRLFNFGLNELKALYAKDSSNYIVPVYNFNDNANSQGGLLGVAIDDGVTGTQALVYGFLTPDLLKAGYGFTDTDVHEIGHHFSLSHPHDGYDYETGYSYGAGGDTLFVNSGDQSATIMSYNDLYKTFGQFNLDSQYRYLTAAYLNNTSAIVQLAREAGASKEAALRTTVRAADSSFASAVKAYQGMDYLTAAKTAHDAYRSVVSAAQAAGVNVQAYRWYEKINALAVNAAAKPLKVNNLRPVKGIAIMPEETSWQRQLRLGE